MASLNRIILVGRLTADPELRTTGDGIPMTRYTLAVEREMRNEAPRQIDFVPVIAWRRLAEVSGQYLKKGRMVLVEGSIQVRSFQTGEGKKKWSTEVVARNVQFLGNSGQPAASAENFVPAEAPPMPSNLEEIPAEDPNLF